MSENNIQNFTVGQRVKIIREKYEPTQGAFAKKLGISRATVSEIENDNTQPSGPLLWAIEYVYKVPKQWILEGTGPDTINKKGSGKALLGVAEPVMPYGVQETDDLIVLARQVLDSETDYGIALKANIRALERALKTEKLLMDHEKRLAALEEKLAAKD